MNIPLTIRAAACFWVVWCAGGCAAPSGRLTFPSHPLSRTADAVWYDLSGKRTRDFGLAYDANGKVSALLYDDLHDGTISRTYRLADYADADVPHVIVLLDSIPYQSVVDRYNVGGFRYCAPPQKIIPPFPSLTEICYSSVLHCPPLTGMIDQSYDPKTRQARSGLWPRIWGYEEPWEQRCDYHASYSEGGLSFLDPRPGTPPSWNVPAWP